MKKQKKMNLGKSDIELLRDAESEIEKEKQKEIEEEIDNELESDDHEPSIGTPWGNPNSH